MTSTPGHDPGHDLAGGADWSLLVRGLVEQFGTWTALAHELIHRCHHLPDAPTDAFTVEKGLRRLSARQNRPGGQYGAWVLRAFGMPHSLARQAVALGQYHSRRASARDFQLN
jgi:hypothetical protein